MSYMDNEPAGPAVTETRRVGRTLSGGHWLVQDFYIKDTKRMRVHRDRTREHVGPGDLLHTLPSMYTRPASDGVLSQMCTMNMH